jgi:hypothetical protein
MQQKMARCVCWMAALNQAKRVSSQRVSMVSLGSKNGCINRGHFYTQQLVHKSFGYCSYLITAFHHNRHPPPPTTVCTDVWPVVSVLNLGRSSFLCSCNVSPPTGQSAMSVQTLGGYVSRVVYSLAINTKHLLVMVGSRRVFAAYTAHVPMFRTTDTPSC